MRPSETSTLPSDDAARGHDPGVGQDEALRDGSSNMGRPFLTFPDPMRLRG
jgi:hypothetical protein